MAIAQLLRTGPERVDWGEIWEADATLEFGAAPNAVEAPENIFDAVVSWACVSNPMTISQLK